MREIVDYDVYYKASREEAEEIIREAEIFVERIARALSEILKLGDFKD